jgi:serine/threonine protein kinase
MCPLWRNYEPRNDERPKPNVLDKVLRERLPYPQWMTDNAVKLISNLLALNPDDRFSAVEAIKSDYFWETPMVKKASDLSMRFGVDSVHEWEARKKHEQRRLQASGFMKK